MAVLRDPTPRQSRPHRLTGPTVVALAAAGVLVVAPGVAFADPTADDVRERIEELEQEFSELNDDYNEAREDYEAAEKRLEEIQEDLDGVHTNLAGLRDSVRSLATLTYSGGDPSSPMYLLGVEDPAKLLEQAADIGYLSTSQQVDLEAYVEERERLESLEVEATDLEERAAEDLERAEEARADGEAAIEEQETLLADLTEDERAAAIPQSTSDSAGASYTGSASGNAAIALEFAYAQIGKPYVWGGTGPNGYDCSGLTQSAWAQAGVSLPRVAADQFHAGTRVSWDSLQPGDLLFFYSSSAPSHVGMYAGNGRMVHASNSSKPVHEVELASYYQAHFVGAIRP